MTLSGAVPSAVGARLRELGAGEGTDALVHGAARPRDADGVRAALDEAWDAIRAAGLPPGPRLIILLAPPPGDAHHAAARAGLENLARTLSIEWAQHGIRPVAVLQGGDGPFLVAGPPSAPSTDSLDALQLAKSIGAEPRALDLSQPLVRDILDDLHRWCARRDAARDALADLALRTPVHLAFARRLSVSLAAAPRHLRPARARAAQVAYNAVRRSVGAGAEAVLHGLLELAPPIPGSDAGELAWLEDVVRALASRLTPQRTRESVGSTVVALLIVSPEGNDSG